MSSKGSILIVDDEPLNLEIIKEILEDKYDLCFATNGEDCLRIAPQLQPELILLDISMPGMSGYEVCKQLKGDRRTQDIQVTFVSALDTLADRLAGYEVGGDDYITKPFDTKELLKKVQVALRNKEMQRHLQRNADKAMQTAMTAITSTNEIGVALQFLSASFQCKDLACIARLVVDTVESFGYRCTVQIRTLEEEINETNESTVNPLEVAVIKRISCEDQIIDMGPRTIINFDNISVLIKGIPVNDPEECERLKENLAVITEGAQMRIGAILAQTRLLNKVGLLDVMRHAQEALKRMNHHQATHKEKIEFIIGDLQKQVAEAIRQFNVSDVAGQAILNYIQQAAEHAVTLFESEKELEENVTLVMGEIQNAMNH
jgi:DNA-binding response OmpR family regulator